MREKVEKVLEEKIKPVLQRDGGDVELIDVNENGVVLVRLQGACSGCPGATMTIKTIIENVLVSEVPGVTQVLGV
ncbi:TPA: NifU family protein [Clostridioides difficile]|nr:NifU family protein [Clostridioides difficile]HBF5457310.1 NifU family protein [Clostridioides difficile]